MTRLDFKDWLQEGKSDCDVAQCLLLTWVRVLSHNDNETVGDLFSHLASEEFAATARANEATPEPETADEETLGVRFLANFVRQNCVLTFHTSAKDEDDVIDELAMRILEEVASVHAYVDSWRA